MLLIFCTLFSLSIFFFTKKRIRRVGKPLSIIFLFWSFILTLYSITPIKYVEMGGYTFLLIFCSFLFFVVGYLISSSGKIYDSNIRFLLAKEKFIAFTVLLVIAGLGALYSKYSNLSGVLGFGFQASVNDLHMIREANLNGDLSLSGSVITKLFDLLILPLLLVGIIAIFEEDKVVRICGALLISVVALHQLTNMSRGFLVYAMFIFLGFFYLVVKNKNKNSNLTKIFFYSLLFLFLFQVISVLRTRDGLDSIIRYTDSIISYESWFPVEYSSSSIFQSNALTLHYFTSGVYGICHYTQNGLPPGLLLGEGNTLNGLYKLLDFVGIIDGFNFKEYDLITTPTNTNVYSFFREQVDDLGFVGTILLHLIWGLVLGYTYKKYLAYPSLTRLVIPVVLTVWYMYGAYIMQTTFANSFVWPFISFAILSFLQTERKLS